MKNIYKSIILVIIGFFMMTYQSFSTLTLPKIDFDFVKYVVIPMIGLVMLFIGGISVGSIGEVIFGKEKYV